MAKPETLDDLLADVIRERRLTAWAREAGIEPWTLLRARLGKGRRGLHDGTIRAIAAKLRLPKARVEAAVQASRDARRG